MRLPRRCFVVGLGILSCLQLTSIPVLAHHSTAMYNMATPATVTGVVTSDSRDEPLMRAFVFLDVKDGSGQTVEWEVEMMSLNHLRGYGWVRDTVKPGDVISCTGGSAKSGAPSMSSSVYEAGGRPPDQIVEGVRRMKAVLPLMALCAAGSTIVWAQAPATGQPSRPAAGQDAPKPAPGAVPAGFDGIALREGAGHSGADRAFYRRARVPPAGAVIHAGVAHGKSRQRDDRSRAWACDPARYSPAEAGNHHDLHHDGSRAGRSVAHEVGDGECRRMVPARAAPSAENRSKQVPRTADGKPDLSGVYGAAGGGGARGAGPGAAGSAPAGPVLKAGAEKFRIVRGPDDTGATSNCMPLVPPQSWGVPYQFQILQGAGSVAIFHEYPGTFRIVPTDGGPHAVDPDPSWLGDSVGRWEGDTLVVDTIGFNDKTELQGFRHTESLHMVEKFRRTALDVLQYEVTIEDPNVFEKPYTLTRTFGLRPDLKRIDEFICENNRDYRPLFGK